MRLASLGIVLATAAVSSVCSGAMTVDIQDYTAPVMPDAYSIQVPVVIDFEPDTETAQINGYQALIRSAVSGPDNSVTISGYSMAPNGLLQDPQVIFGDIVDGQEVDVVGDFAISAGTATDGMILFYIDVNIGAGASGVYTIEWLLKFGADGNYVSDNSGVIANVTFSDGVISLVPEPATLGIIGLAGLMLGRRRTVQDQSRR